MQKNTIECHRALLVTRKLFEAGIHVNHILVDGSLETQEKNGVASSNYFKLSEDDMFKSRAEFIAEAYMMQGWSIFHWRKQEIGDSEQVVTLLKIFTIGFTKKSAEKIFSRA